MIVALCGRASALHVKAGVTVKGTVVPHARALNMKFGFWKEYPFSLAYHLCDIQAL